MLLNFNDKNFLEHRHIHRVWRGALLEFLGAPLLNLWFINKIL